MPHMYAPKIKWHIRRPRGRRKEISGTYFKANWYHVESTVSKKLIDTLRKCNVPCHLGAFQDAVGGHRFALPSSCVLVPVNGALHRGQRQKPLTCIATPDLFRS